MGDIEPIMRIADNRFSISELNRQVGSNIGIIPFVGAGLSAPMGLPTWTEFLRTLGVKAGVTVHSKVAECIESGKFECAASVLEEALGEHWLQDAIEQEYGDFHLSELHGKAEKEAVYRLPELSAGPVITTNFDSVVEKVFEIRGVPFQKVIYGVAPDWWYDARTKNAPYLLKIHGDATERSTRVLTYDEYRSHYGDIYGAGIDSEKPLPKAVADTLVSRPLLFLGCSLQHDWVVRTMAVVAQANPTMEHYAIMAVPNDEGTWNQRQTDLARCCIRPIWFPSGRFESIALIIDHVAGCPRVLTISGIRFVRIYTRDAVTGSGSTKDVYLAESVLSESEWVAVMEANERHESSTTGQSTARVGLSPHDAMDFCRQFQPQVVQQLNRRVVVKVPPVEVLQRVIETACGPTQSRPLGQPIHLHQTKCCLSGLHDLLGVVEQICQGNDNDFVIIGGSGTEPLPLLETTRSPNVGFRPMIEVCEQVGA